MGITISATTIVNNLTIGPTPIYGVTIPTNNLILYLDAGNNDSYPGSGTIWYDLSPSDNTSYITGATFNSNGLKSNFSFNGTASPNSGDYVRVPVSNVTTFFNPYAAGTTGFTISLWIKTNTTITSTIYGETASDAINSGSGWAPTIMIDRSGKIYTEGYYNGTGGAGVTGSTLCNDNQYHNIVITKSGTSLSLYIDRVLQGSITKTPVGYSAVYYHWIGAGRNDGRCSGTYGVDKSYYFKGSIYNFIIYKRALTQSEITNLYNQYSPLLR
jgi:hypothetical protein